MKTSNIKVAVFPMGSIVRFRRDTIERSYGRLEYYKMIWSMVRNPSISEVWVMQNTDWKHLTEEEKIEFDPRGVLRDIFTELDVKKPNSKYQDNYTDLWEKVKDLEQPDFAVVFSTQGLVQISIPGIIPTVKDPTRMTKCLEMTIRYCSSQMHYLNMSNIPYFLVVNDGRFITKTQKYRDMFNLPKEILAFYQDEITIKHYNKLPSEGGEYQEDIVPMSYSKMIWLNNINEPIVLPDAEKPNKFSIVAMQAAYGKSTHDSRYKALKEWFLDVPGNDDLEIYGKWNENFTEGYPQFKGLKTHEEIDEIFKKTRYTLLIPTQALWVTTKIVEMLTLGVIPFVHPNYDEKCLSFPKDSFFRVKTPQELKEKIQILEENPEKRIKIVQMAQEKYLKGVNDGTCIVDALNPFLEKHNINVRLQNQFSEEIIRQADKTKINLAKALF
jgi:hypothetical protein